MKIIIALVLTLNSFTNFNLFSIENEDSLMFVQQITNQIKPSKEDTKIWILQKLNRYSKNIHFQSPPVTLDFFGTVDLSSTTEDFSFEFYNDEWLKINYKSSKVNYVAYIPICDVSFVRVNPTNLPHSDNSNFKFSSYKRLITDNGKESDEFSICIDFVKEDNLDNRLIKAFENLKSYCVKKTNKETF